MENEKTIDVLNKLVVINNDRIEGYEKALENTEEKEFKTLFSKFIKTSQTCRHELVREIKKLGGKAEDGTKLSGKFFRAWMDVKSALTGNDRKAILKSCANGEEKAVETYQDVLEDDLEHLNSKQQTMIRDQYALIKSDRDKISSMQKTVVEPS